MDNNNGKYRRARLQQRIVGLIHNRFENLNLVKLIQLLRIVSVIVSDANPLNQLSENKEGLNNSSSWLPPRRSTVSFSEPLEEARLVRRKMLVDHYLLIIDTSGRIYSWHILFCYYACCTDLVIETFLTYMRRLIHNVCAAVS